MYLMSPTPEEEEAFRRWMKSYTEWALASALPSDEIPNDARQLMNAPVFREAAETIVDTLLQAGLSYSQVAFACVHAASLTLADIVHYYESRIRPTS